MENTKQYVESTPITGGGGAQNISWVNKLLNSSTFKIVIIVVLLVTIVITILLFQNIQKPIYGNKLCIGETCLEETELKNIKKGDFTKLTSDQVCIGETCLEETELKNIKKGDFTKLTSDQVCVKQTCLEETELKNIKNENFTKLKSSDFQRILNQKSQVVSTQPLFNNFSIPNKLTLSSGVSSTFQTILYGYGPWNYAPDPMPGAKRFYRIYAIWTDNSTNGASFAVRFHKTVYDNSTLTSIKTNYVDFLMPNTWGSTDSTIANRNGFSYSYLTGISTTNVNEIPKYTQFTKFGGVPNGELNYDKMGNFPEIQVYIPSKIPPRTDGPLNTDTNSFGVSISYIELQALDIYD